MKRLFCAVFISLLFFSCNTSAHFPVPGESEVKKNNMYVEYLNIANTYMDLEKFDKAIEFYSKAGRYDEAIPILYEFMPIMRKTVFELGVILLYSSKYGMHMLSSV